MVNNLFFWENIFITIYKFPIVRNMFYHFILEIPF